MREREREKHLATGPEVACRDGGRQEAGEESERVRETEREHALPVLYARDERGG